MAAKNISKQMTVADVLTQTPQTLGIFVEHGFVALKDPQARATLAKTVTVEQAARLHGIDVEVLLVHLNNLQSRMHEASLDTTLDGDGLITADHSPGVIIEQHPYLLDVFVRYGFESLRDETLRRTVASMVTLDTACRIHDIDLTKLLRDLNAAK